MFYKMTIVSENRTESLLARDLKANAIENYNLHFIICAVNIHDVDKGLMRDRRCARLAHGRPDREMLV